MVNLAPDTMAPFQPDKQLQLANYLNRSVSELMAARDIKTALNIISALVVPELADWFTIDLIENGSLKELIMYCQDAEKLAHGQDYRRKYPANLNSYRTRDVVATTGKPILTSFIDPQKTLELAATKNHPYVDEILRMQSSITVPISNRSNVTGVIRLMSMRPGRYYDEDDLAFAMNFASHVGLVLENARLNEQAQAEITHRKEIETKLRFTQLRLQSALSSGQVGTWIMNINTGQMFPDESLCKLFGLQYNVHGMQQSLFREKVHPDDKPLYYPERKDMQAGQHYETEYRIITDNGIRWVFSRGRLAEDTKSNMLLTGITMDITDRKLVANALRESDDRYTATFDNVSVGIVLSAFNGTLIKANEAFSQITGYRQDELLGVSFKSITYPDDIPQNEALYQQLFAGNIPFFIYEKRYYHKNGYLIWVRSSTSLVKDAENNPAYAVIVVEDITEQKRAEDELAASEAHFKALAQLNSLPIWQVNEKFETVFVNDTWRTYTGVKHETITENDWFDRIHPDERAATITQFNNLFTKRDPVNLRYRFYHAPTDTYRWMLDNAQPVFDPHFKGYIGTMTDIEEQEQARLASQELATKKDEFISVASHELKTPITTIKAFIQLLQRDLKKDGKIHPFADRAERQLGRLERLVSDLLEVSRINAGKTTYHFEHLNLSETVRETVAYISQNANERSLIVETEDELILEGDRHRIEQVLINLLNNAIKYSKPGTEIKVMCKQFEDNIILSVSDQGIGIAPEVKDQLFDRFFQVNAQHFPGLGLGLYITKEIIERHNGTISVESTPDKGSTFIVSLPFKQGI